MHELQGQGFSGCRGSVARVGDKVGGWGRGGKGEGLKGVEEGSFH
jgi:hypothetical protein